MDSEPPIRRTSPRRIILSVFAIAGIALAYFVFMHTVCKPIPISRLRDFESVQSLEERAASGEPFEKRDGRWQV